ncbi:4Fe-4S binding protein [uncultured Adlercreutzia sp.]|uniref:4Fe-4S binding protein n=1 Tax=uncultured Adlercreutzia sp. TaxID=875803 RepID=UPI0025DE86DF|nr:4Fe-4S binding protein [uncultured Adlercreutzia sp.]
MKPSTLRKITVAAVFILVAVSLATNAATGTLSAIGFESIALICPVGALEVMLGLHQFLLHPFILLLVVVAALLLVGKAFCAWLCPTPMLQALFRPGKKKGKKDAAKDAGEAKDASEPAGAALAVDSAKAAVALTADEKAVLSGCSHSCTSCGSLAPCGGKRDGFKLDTRFAVLGGALASAAIFGFPVFCLICPVGLTFATFIGLWHLFQFNETTWGLLLFPALLILELVVLRKWCHKFCPISALMSLVSTGNKFLKPQVNEEKCLRSRGIDCHACVDACPELLDPHMSDIPECSKCGKCKEVCPAGAITFPFFARKKAGAPALERDKAPSAAPAFNAEDLDEELAEA